MSLLRNAEECILLSKDALSHFPNVRDIVDESDFRKWTLGLQGNPDFKNLFGNSKFNLLNTSILAGLANRRELTDPISNHTRQLLGKVDLFLESFTQLKADNSWKDKLKNLGGLNFLSTLSELSLAFYLKKLGFKVSFEKKFMQKVSGAQRDIDLVIRDSDNHEFNIEVYMPNHQLEVEGFFDPDQDDDGFSEKINKKLIKKFGLDGIIGLNGKTLLSINKVFFDMIHVKTVLPFFSNEIVYNGLAKLLPIGIDGLIIFEDDFGSQDSFKLEKLLWTVDETTLD